MVVGPVADLPFDPPAVDAMRLWLTLCGIEPDRPWLKGGQPTAGHVLTRDQTVGFLAEARRTMPSEAADWEVMQFAGFGVASSIGILKWGGIANYREFHFLMLRLLGINSERWLPMLFAAAVTSPTFPAEEREAWLASMTAADLHND